MNAKTVTPGREYRLLTALVNGGKTLTVNQIKKQFGLKNPSAAIDRFAKNGINIQRVYTTKKFRTTVGTPRVIPITTVKYSVIASTQNKSKKK